MRFSERHGFKTVREAIQKESMDSSLRIGLWNLLTAFCWDHVKLVSVELRSELLVSGRHNTKHYLLCVRLWDQFFHEPLYELPRQWKSIYKTLRSFFFDAEWYEVYDFVEFVCNNYEDGDFNTEFQKVCNICLTSNVSAYRFVDGLISEIVSEEEIEAIEDAATSADEGVASHLRRALELLSDRTKPDYRNSIKESISAVEAKVALVSGDKGTLGQLIKEIDEHVEVHPALQSAFSKLYGYTSDEGGIRHAILDETIVDFHDAKFMLVACSAFINYAEGKLSDT